MTVVADLVDAALEWSVIGSFTRVGPVLRRRLEHWAPLGRAALTGRVVVITGGTSGLGLEAARRFAAMGATVEILARNARKAEATCVELREETGSKTLGFVVADTGDLAALRHAAAELIRRHPAIHVLIHNAGALDERYQQSPQGIELTVASQVVGPFLLTGLLRPALRAGAPARVLWVSSGGMYSEPLSVQNLEMSADHYHGTTAYARAKRAQVCLAERLATELGPDGIVVQAMHPGWAETPGVKRSLPTFERVLGPLLRTPEQGADTLVWLATDDEAAVADSGRFWLDRRPRSTHRLGRTRRADTPEERERLWRWTVEKSGLETA